MGSRDVEAVAALLSDVADLIAATLGELGDWGLAGTRAGQYRSDIAADDAAVRYLVEAGVGVLSEETGLHHPERDITVVLDPLDGSTNAAHGVPWYATSLCAVDAEGPLAALVVDLARGRRYEATRGGGARRDGERITTGATTALSDAFVGLSGLPAQHLGWRQFRALGASALDLCAVADGTLDAFIDCSADAHGPWDYLGAMLVCKQPGATVTDALGRDLVVLDHDTRRTPVAACTESLHRAAMEARRLAG
jgi:myo-inositol-1(or 4)-monophosphatase